MGKIRIKTLGDEELEKEQKKEARKKQEAKKIAKVEEVEKTKAEEATEGKVANLSEVSKASREEKKSHKTPKTPRSHRSQRYQTVEKIVDKNKIYKLNEALELLPKAHMSKFDETVELHINTTETGISGNINLPHGTGKKIRVAIANEEVISQIEKGKIDFDMLLAAPQMMPKLAKVARILGPKGLMPNPKNGTISQNPQEAARKFEGGQTNFKTEAKAPIIHMSVGKLSFGEKKLSENIKTALNAISADKFKKVVLKSTMSPGIKIDLTGFA